MTDRPRRTIRDPHELVWDVTDACFRWQLKTFTNSKPHISAVKNQDSRATTKTSGWPRRRVQPQLRTLEHQDHDSD